MLYHVVTPDDTITFLSKQERDAWVDGLEDVEYVECESEVEESVFARVTAMRDRSAGPAEEGR